MWQECWEAPEEASCSLGQAEVWIQGITKGPHSDRETCLSVCVCAVAACISVCQDHIKHSELFRER